MRSTCDHDGRWPADMGSGAEGRRRQRRPSFVPSAVLIRSDRHADDDKTAELNGDAIRDEQASEVEQMQQRG